MQVIDELKSRSAPERLPHVSEGIGEACANLQSVLSSSEFQSIANCQLPELASTSGGGARGLKSEERVMLRLEDGAEDMYDDDTISSDSTRLPSPCSAQTSPRSLNRSIATPASNRSSSAPARRRIETAMTSQGA